MSHEIPDPNYTPNLDPKSDLRDSPDAPDDDEPDTVATPQGDMEGYPDAPPTPVPPGMQIPPSIDTNKIKPRP
jgi:hypothetical protein